MFDNKIFSLANGAFIALAASKISGVNKHAYVRYARSQINYMLGDGGRSFVIGFGRNPPKRPHHRSRYLLLEKQSVYFVNTTKQLS